MDLVEKAVHKGGITWLEMSVGRTAGRLDIWLKALPEIEQFFKGLSGDRKELVEAFDREWFSFEKQPIHIYWLEKDPGGLATYTTIRPGSALISPRDGKFNLSFLRIAGISSPEGVRFGVNGPCSKPFVKDISDLILKETNKFLYDFIVPVQINLRITSTEV